MLVVDKVLFSSGKDDWQTPIALFTVQNTVYHYTVDAAANATNFLLPRWWGPGSPLGIEDSLSNDWTGERVWLNPPYSMIKQFVKKASYEMHAHNVHTTMLIPSRTDTKYFQDYIWDFDHATWQPGIRGNFLRGRLKFVDPSGKPATSAPFPSALIHFAGF